MEMEKLTKMTRKKEGGEIIEEKENKTPNPITFENVNGSFPVQPDRVILKPNLPSPPRRKKVPLEVVYNNSGETSTLKVNLPSQVKNDQLGVQVMFNKTDALKLNLPRPTSPTASSPQSSSKSVSEQSMSSPLYVDSDYTPDKPKPRAVLRPAKDSDCGDEHVIVSRSCLEKLVSLISCCRCNCRATEVVLREPCSGSEAIPFVNWYCAQCSIRDRIDLQKFTNGTNTKLRTTAVLIATAVILTGICVAKLRKFMELAGLRMPSEGTFYAVRDQVGDIVNKFCMNEKEKLISNMIERQETAGGATLALDGQFDTPGHSASFCAVGAYDLHQRKIVDTEILHRSEAGDTSAPMEKLGIKRALTGLIAKGVDVDCVVIDRCPANIKMLKDDFPQIEIQHDYWHVGKKIFGTFWDNGKSKKNFRSKWWAPIVKNHFFSLCQQADGNNAWLEEQIRIMLEEHLVDNHTNCLHPKDDKKRAYFPVNSPELKKIQDKLLRKQTLESFGRCSRYLSTGMLECHHCTRIHFLPKGRKHTVKTDDEGFAVTKVVNRRDSKKWTESLVYVVKDRSYQYELLDLVQDTLKISTVPVLSGRQRPDTIARKLEFRPYVDSPRPVGEAFTELHDKFGMRMAKRASLVHDGIHIPPIRESNNLPKRGRHSSPIAGPSTSKG